jgi:hypothetical protein
VQINADFSLVGKNRNSYYSYQFVNGGQLAGDCVLVFSATNDPVQHRAPLSIRD